MSAVASVIITCDGCGARVTYTPQKGQAGISARPYVQRGQGKHLPASRREGKDYCPTCA